MIRASAETCYECLRGENKQKLEVLSFEKAWDKIEKDTVDTVDTVDMVYTTDMMHNEKSFHTRLSCSNVSMGKTG